MTEIDICGLTKKYGTKTAVDNISLTVDKGEFFALLGMNGAGKSTTIKMLSCLIAPSSGDALISGHSIIRQQTQVKKIINVSPQQTAVAPNLTVRENLEFICGIYGDTKNAAKQKSEAMIKRFGLEEVGGSKAKTLSGGWCRRLSVAMALITDPEVLFLDEPTLGLDVLARRELWSLISQLKGSVTVILTTHYLEEAEQLCDRIGIMTAGRIAAVGTTEQLKEKTGKQTLEEAFISLCGGELK